jgi:hypothetical protein
MQTWYYVAYWCFGGVDQKTTCGIVPTGGAVRRAKKKQTSKRPADS